MCGITGFAERNHKAETARRIVKGMADLITYRGPDGEGYLCGRPGSPGPPPPFHH